MCNTESNIKKVEIKVEKLQTRRAQRCLEAVGKLLWQYIVVYVCMSVYVCTYMYVMYIYAHIYEFLLC